MRIRQPAPGIRFPAGDVAPRPVVSRIEPGAHGRARIPLELMKVQNKN